MEELLSSVGIKGPCIYWSFDPLPKTSAVCPKSLDPYHIVSYFVSLDFLNPMERGQCALHLLPCIHP